MTDKPGPGATGQLRTLERWRTLELEDAQAQYAAQARVVDTREAEVERVARAIEDTQSFVRERLQTSASLAVDSLQRLTQFAAHQAGEMQVAQAALAASQADSERARAAMVEQYRELAVVERLRERREAAGAREALQEQQKRLDEHALIRVAADGATTQDTSHED